MAEDSPIKYLYNSKKFSAACVRHAFSYLSALSGIQFIEDSKSPDIIQSYEQAISPSARIVISKDESSRLLVKDVTNGNWIVALNYDPVETVASRLSLKGKSGPYANKQPLPSSERNLSAVVCEFVNALCRAEIIANRTRPITLWPEPFRFGLAVTHDIDIASRSVPGSLRLLVNHALPGGWKALWDSLKSAIGLMPNPYDAVDKWIELESKLGIKSTWFIFDGLRCHSFDPKYKPGSISRSLVKMRNNDYEIALHSSIDCFSGNSLSGAKSRLEQSANVTLSGLRPHYLSAFYPEYWQAAANVGFSYSSALGFDQGVGFWNGIDLPFYPFDTSKDGRVPIVEIPIAIMDCGLIDDLAADSAQPFEKAIRLIDSAAASGGLIVLDWHQRTFYNLDYPGWSDLFAKIVRYAKGKGACHYRLDELASYFKKRFGS